MFDRSQPEQESSDQCQHCWVPVPKGWLRFNGKIFCSPKCFRQYYGCIIRLFLIDQGKRLKVFILRKKSWSAGVLAGSILSLILAIIFGFVLSNPFSGRRERPPITEATVDLPLGIRYPFALNTSTQNLPHKDPSVSQKVPAVIEDTRERHIKESVKIFLIKEYPSGAQKTVGISGQASPGSICALYINDVLYEATTCSKGIFFFPRVTLGSGKNIIEVLVHDPEGYIVPSNTFELFVDLNRQITEMGKNFTRGSLDKPMVCLTFDGGASASCAPEILDTLKKYQIKSTFFLTGDFIRNHPDLVKRMLAEGHEIGNHTDTHPHFARLTSHMRFQTLPWVNKAFVQNQIKRAEKAFFQVTGRRMAPFWRAPYGEHNLEILRWGEEIGYNHVSWTCGRVLEEGLDSLDWVYNEDSPIYFSAEEIRDKIIHFGEGSSEGANGGIVLMHLASSRPIEDRIHHRLPEIIEGLRKRGYHFSTVSQVIDLPQKPIYAEEKKETSPAKSATHVVEKEEKNNPGRRCRRELPI